MDPLNTKHYPLYMSLAEQAATQSLSNVKKVGAIVVLPSGMISLGWNGMPSGFDNCCENPNLQKIDEDTGELRPSTKPEVIHAERNAIDKFTREGVSIRNSVLFVTLSPCFECAKAMLHLGIKEVVYKKHYKCTKGLMLLIKAGILVTFYEAFHAYSQQSNSM